MDIPGEPAPSLHPHPSKQELHRYYEPVRQRAPRPVLNAFGCCLGTLPLATFGAYDPGRRFRRSPSHVPCKSRRPGSRRLYAGHHLAKNTGTRQAHLEGKARTLDFDVVKPNHDASTATPDQATDPTGRFWNVFLVPT